MPPDSPATAFAWKDPRSWQQQAWWPWTKRIVSLLFFALVAWLIVSRARTIEWSSVWTSLKDIPASVLGMAGLLTVLTYLVYCSFDLIGRYCSRHKLSHRLVLFITFISYAFNLNLGTIVGGVAFRYRLYGHFGLHGGQIAHVTALSMVTNWIGYCALAGMVFLVWPLPLPPQWDLGTGDMRWLGALALGLALLYVALCAWRGGRDGRDLVIRGRAIPMAGWRIALLQIGLSAIHWMLMAAIIFVLLQGQAAYPAVLATLLVAAIAGVLAHIPAGLGVTEAVFVALMGHQVEHGPLLAALLAYRGIYYLAPLAIAGVSYLVVELQRRREDEAESGVA
ncbi:lysylphosphatidylglycerol synthase domain-containing protein [Xylophilus sp. GOD-11R]|uniref:lysylphosphatidylglycerol synthase domain-containing protein n=1 Tax=Xylophilus sp. GOD-11R TaxID=3089814 RepID=UPI00298C5D15|nr:lysylphosphatidylglycerol synthase domain-containing protein [Xylophilus sp. GOD-11R]WPB57021.1 lysylphosphatidylglycerol synthase domain-containing protein [Xylophilus sp. GOD-11R]